MAIWALIDYLLELLALIEFDYSKSKSFLKSMQSNGCDQDVE